MNTKKTFTKEEILEGIELKQFEVYYQPIVDKEKGEVVLGEALIRWNHPQLGLLHPGNFISAAETTGAIRELGEFVLREAITQSKKWKEAGYPFFRVTVNISLAQIADANFIDKVFAILQETKMSPHDLELEITESLAMIDPFTTQSTLEKLKDIGVRIVLDDFGAGYSSLNHLNHFPVDGLKIDGEFIRNSLKSEKDAKLMQSIILLAQSLDLHIVAEGVETKEQLDLLSKFDCHTIQGFYFSHPMPSKEYLEWCTYFASTPELRT